jgi:Tol biopolymer transport system component
MVASRYTPRRSLAMGSAHQIERFSRSTGAFTGWSNAGVHSWRVNVLWPRQVYIQLVPDGQPIQLTRDKRHKMSPAFSADGTRIAYTTLENFDWDTWVVPTKGGEPHLWSRNASGPVWAGPHRVMFSEIEIGKSPHGDRYGR